MSIRDNIASIQQELPATTTLIAVTKTRSIEEIKAVVLSGIKDLGENRVQDLIEKASRLNEPSLRWHLIGHLQRNKVKTIIPFVHLIHSVDSMRLFDELVKESSRQKISVRILLQVYIAKEESKFGLNDAELSAILHKYVSEKPEFLTIKGLMGMASNTSEVKQIEHEFKGLHALFNELKISFPFFQILSMGMSSDYKIAIRNGSTHVRIGSALFQHV